MGMSIEESERLTALEDRVNELLASHASLRKRVEEHLDGVDAMDALYKDSADDRNRAGRAARPNARPQGADSA